MKPWFGEMVRLSIVVGAGLGAGWQAGAAVMPHVAAPAVVAAAPIKAQASTGPLLALAEPAPASPSSSTPAIQSLGGRPGACSLDPRDYADDRPIGAPDGPGRKKKHGVACG